MLPEPTPPPTTKAPRPESQEPTAIDSGAPPILVNVTYNDTLSAYSITYGGSIDEIVDPPQHGNASIDADGGLPTLILLEQTK